MTATDFPRHAFVVLGMHRSGTSALAGVLSLFGADLPQHQMVPTIDNPKGYFESTPIKQLNDRILESAGTSWDDWTELPSGWFSGPRAGAFKAEAREVLGQEFGTSPLFVLKDPRICRIWPFWRDVLAEAGVAPIPIIMLRHPAEVAASLLRRDNLPLGVSRLIWLRYVLSAEHATRVDSRVITTFDALLSDRISFLHALEHVSGFSLPRRSLATEAEVADFLSSGLRRFAAEDSEAQQFGPSLFVNVYESLKAPDAQTTKQLQTRLDKVARLIDSQAELIFGLAGPLREVVAGHADLERRLQKKADDEGLLKATLSDKDAMIVEFGQRLAEAEAKVTSLSGRNEDLARSLSAAERQLGEAQAKVQELKTVLKATLSDKDAMIVEFGQRLAEAEAKAQELETISRAGEATIQRLNGELARIVSVAQQRDTGLAGKLRQEVAKERRRVEAEFRASRSWRFAAPLRGIGKLARRLKGVIA